ncbi:MAG: nucleotidyltransferase [Deltaproteobacteria bacterium]|nr:nucleotidyltransferase [Deltaproteobacteria bacterium]
MLNLFQKTAKIQKELHKDGMPSIVIGGLAVAVWGEPRLTADIDLKIQLNRDDASKLVFSLKPHYRLLANNPIETIKKVGFIFIQDTSNTRIDLLLADTPFDIQAIERGKKVHADKETSLTICSPEDLIIYKMISTRPRDREDVRGIIIRQKKNLDHPYLLDWLTQFEKAIDDSTLVVEYNRMFKSL